MCLSPKASSSWHLPVVEIHITTGVVGSFDINYNYLQTLLYTCYYTLLLETIT